MSMTQRSAAAGRVRSTADRLTALRARLERLHDGEPVEPRDARRAHEQAIAQARALAVAQERTLLAHESAAARHEEYAERLTRDGRFDAAEREHAAASRERWCLATRTRQRAVTIPDLAAAGRPHEEPTCATAPRSSPEVVRLRRALVALMAWAGPADLDEVDRRQVWCRSIVEQCGAPGWRSWIEATCIAAPEALPGVRGAAITGMAHSGPELVAASDGWSRQAQELELILGEGPATTAYTDSRSVVIDDLQTERDAWQGFASASSGLGIRGVVALPLRMHADRVGSLTLYHVGSITTSTRRHLADAGAFADLAAAALLADIDRARHQAPASEDLFVVQIAAGALSVRLGVAIDEAHARIRALAFGSGSSLLEVANAVLEGRPTVA